MPSTSPCTPAATSQAAAPGHATTVKETSTVSVPVVAAFTKGTLTYLNKNIHCLSPSQATLMLFANTLSASSNKRNLTKKENKVFKQAKLAKKAQAAKGYRSGIYSAYLTLL